MVHAEERIGQEAHPMVKGIELSEEEYEKGREKIAEIRKKLNKKLSIN